jgi:AcrR family transcriptional regulator
MAFKTRKRTPARCSSHAKVDQILSEAFRILRDSPSRLSASRVSQAAGVSPSYFSIYVGNLDSLKKALIQRHFNTLSELQPEVSEAIQDLSSNTSDALSFLLSHLLGRQAPDRLDPETHFEVCRLSLLNSAFNGPWATSLASVFIDSLSRVSPDSARSDVSNFRASQTASWACLGLLFGYALSRPRTDYSPENLFEDMSRVALSLLDRDPTRAIQDFEEAESGRIAV